MFDLQSSVVALLTGFVPALIWLVFWLREDRHRPEPNRLIARAFMAGMAAVVFVLPLEKIALGLFPTLHGVAGFPLVFAWASIEEVMKLVVAWLIILRKRAVDEPLDIPIYLITVALGFAALENTLFLATPFGNGEFVTGLVAGDLRAIGATLIHVLSSAVIGGSLALAFYGEREKKLWYGVGGVILAILLHSLFNFSILATSADHLLTVFTGVWAGIIFILLAFERIKIIARPPWWAKLFVKKQP